MLSEYLRNGSEIFLTIFVIVKHCYHQIHSFGSTSKNRTAYIALLVLYPILSIIILTLLTLIFLACWIFKNIINVYLQFKYNNNYGGIVQSADRFFTVEEEESKSIINGAYTIKFNRSKEEFKNYVRRTCENILSHDARFTSVRKSCLGYTYFVKNQLTVDDVLSNMRLCDTKICNKEQFEGILEEYANAPLPRNDTATWQLIAGSQSVILSDSGKKTQQYPVIIRIHHSVGDGVTITSFIIRTLSDLKNSVACKSPKMLVNSVFEDTNNTSAIKTGFIKVFKKIKNVLDVNLYILALLSKTDSNILRGPKITGKKIVCCYVEEEPNYVHKVKRIKSAVTKTTFNSVIMAAVSASMYEHFKQHSGIVPEQMKLIFTFTLNQEDLKYKATKLENRFTAGILHLPICIKTSENLYDSFMERLKIIKTETEKFSKSLDALANFWQMRICCHFLPLPILKKVIERINISTLSFTNMPGFMKMKILDEDLIHLLFWNPNVMQMGIGISILTYDDCFQMGLLVDKALVSDKGQARAILNNIFKYIDLMDKELQSVASPSI